MTNGKRYFDTALTGAAAVAVVLSTIYGALAQSAAPSDPTDAGKAVFKRANCFGCHKWHGNGGSGYGGGALSLRKNEPAREKITENIACRRAGTGLPVFTPGAYATGNCYGLNRHDDVGQMPPPAQTLLLA